MTVVTTVQLIVDRTASWSRAGMEENLDLNGIEHNGTTEDIFGKHMEWMRIEIVSDLNLAIDNAIESGALAALD